MCCARRGFSARQNRPSFFTAEHVDGPHRLLRVDVEKRGLFPFAGDKRAYNTAENPNDKPRAPFGFVLAAGLWDKSTRDNGAKRVGFGQQIGSDARKRDLGGAGV